MFASFKKLFRKDAGNDLATSIPEISSLPDPQGWTPTGASHNPIPFPSGNISPVSMPLEGIHTDEYVSLPLRSVLARLPNSLSSIVQSQGNGFIAFPAWRILQELPKGAVKINFGEIRQSAPPETFADNARHDLVLVELPLNEILARLNPALMTRRANQKQVIVSDEVTDIFGPRGEGLSLSNGLAPASKPARPAPLTPSAPAPAVPPVAPLISMARVEKVEVPLNSPIPLDAATLRIVPLEKIVPTANETLSVEISTVIASWPTEVKKEVAEKNLFNAVILFPMDAIENSLKTGKIIFTWKQVAPWIQPKIASTYVPGDTVIEFPLSVIAPLFLTRHRPKIQKKLSVIEASDMFAGPQVQHFAAPQPAVVSALGLPPKVLPTPVTAPPTQGLPAPCAPIVPVMKPANVMGEALNQPAKSDWSPDEIVNGLTALPGVSGAFIAMNDGLLVAAHLSSEYKGETLAAFLPQIFGKMNHYTTELKLGAIESLTFEVNTISWQLVKAGSAFLVAVGKPTEELPSSQLKAIAAELRKKIQ